METLALSSIRFNNVVENLHKHYDYDGCNYANEGETVIVAIPIDRSELEITYDTLIGERDNRKAMIDTLCLVSYYMEKDSLGISSWMYGTLSSMIREDLLKLYLLLHDEQHDISWISIRTVCGTVKLRNYCNWFLDDMVKTYILKNIADIKDAEHAKDELAKIKRRRGRIPIDPRLRHLLWGTFSLLKDHCRFSSPMPNRLCLFLIRYLQILNILPQDTEIDTFWIRAQLRYIRSQKLKEANQAL